MKIGIVCPYSWDIPGGVQAHVRDLAEKLIEEGHDVSVLAPGDDELPDIPAYVVITGKAVPFPYNGSVARVQFGVLAAARVRRWLKDGEFDVVHVHEPAAASLSLLAVMLHDGPLVATFHMATSRSRFLSMFENALQPFFEKMSGRIAVSPSARKVIVEHLGADAVVIPNGVDVAHFASAEPLADFRGDGQTVGFIGRFGESRKGMEVLIAAVELLAGSHPKLRVVVAGRGDGDALKQNLPPAISDRFEMLGQISEDDKASLLRSIDVYCAPNTGQESFGIILLEAMAAGAPVVASDLEAFRRVLVSSGDDGHSTSEAAAEPAGELFAVGNSAALATALARVLDDASYRDQLIARGKQTVLPYDWSVITGEIVRVYELAIAGSS